jgi:uncharacterized lipoprotein YmbA
MISPRSLAAVTALTVCLTACSSAPIRYYSLVGTEPPEVADADPAHRVPFVLTRVGVPAQVDQPQLVVREGPQRVDLLEGDRWIAPLGDELRAALSADLARDLPGRDVTGLPEKARPALSIRVTLRRFDSVPGERAVIEAAWTLSRPAGDDKTAGLGCSTQIDEPVAVSAGPGYDALVQAHQRALAKLALAIATAAKGLAQSAQGVCP